MQSLFSSVLFYGMGNSRLAYFVFVIIFYFKKGKMNKNAEMDGK